ncbi:hypothetical protein C8J57DRAFT_1719209, partial [Mycena rebaudengoi]
MTKITIELRAQLERIREEEAALYTKRQSILRRLDAVVYPVLTLPSDITAEIFMHYIGDPIIENDRHDALNPYSPLLLASVCKAWRSVALYFPRLWATLKLQWNPKTVIRCEKLLQCWLLRAGGCLLDLDLSDSDLTESKSIYAAIVQYAPQLRRLTLAAPRSASHFSSATAGAQLCFPALQSLTLDFPALSDELAITDAPRLREVCISGGSTSLIHLPWNQLTRLDLKDDLTSALQVLKQTPNLEVFSFCSLSDFDDDQTPVVMRKLQTLRIDPSSSWGFFNSLTAPVLKTLELGYPMGSDRAALHSFTSRSSCPVQAIHLHDQTAEEIIDTLMLFKSLEHLTVQFSDWWHERAEDYSSSGNYDIEDGYCSSVFGFLEKPGQLPALKSSSFIDFPMAMDAALLTSMLDSRRQSLGVANLESFKLVFERPAQEGYEEAHASKLRTLVDRGLSIHIEWPTRTGEPSKNVNPEMVRFSVVLRLTLTELNTGCSNQSSFLTPILAGRGAVEL